MKKLIKKMFFGFRDLFRDVDSLRIHLKSGAVIETSHLDNWEFNLHKENKSYKLEWSNPVFRNIINIDVGEVVAVERL